MSGQISAFLRHHYRHFNAAALIDAADGYRAHLDGGGKMMITLAGAMSTAELGLSLAEMIRRDKVQIITCTGANLEEDLFNLVAHDFYERVPHYRDLTPGSPTPASPRWRRCVGWRARCSRSGWQPTGWGSGTSRTSSCTA